MSSEWYYRRGDEEFGPISSRRIRRMAWRGELLPSDLIWKQGMPGWRPAGDSKRLFGPDRHRDAPRRGRKRSRSPSLAARLEPDKPLFGWLWTLRRPLLAPIAIGVAAGIPIAVTVAVLLVVFDNPRGSWPVEEPPP